MVILEKILNFTILLFFIFDLLVWRDVFWGEPCQAVGAVNSWKLWKAYHVSIVLVVIFLWFPPTHSCCNHYFQNLPRLDTTWYTQTIIYCPNLVFLDVWRFNLWNLLFKSLDSFLVGKRQWSGWGWGTSVGCHNGEMPPCVFVVMGVGQSHV